MFSRRWSFAYQNEHKEEAKREAQNVPAERLGRMHRGATKEAGNCEVPGCCYRFESSATREVVGVQAPLDGIIEESKEKNKDADEEPHFWLEWLSNFEDLSAFSCAAIET